MQCIKLRIPHELAEFIRHLHPRLKRKVRSALQALGADPLLGKALKDELEGLRSLRPGRLRIIYRLHGRSMELVAMGPRRNIYRETYRLLRKKDAEAR